MILFRVRDLKKVYGDRTVLDIPYLEFEKGLIYTLLGPNGSGKTTLLEILALLIRPTSGSLRYEGVEIDFSRNNLAALRREIVMVQQNPVLFTTSVYKNVEFGLKVRGISREERSRAVEEALDLVGMGGFVGADADRLSGGETQRVAIARAMACSPKVIFFDEPTANVDLENQFAIERIITDINTEKGISVILTTHNLTQASRISGDLVHLFNGSPTGSAFENVFSGRVLKGKDGRRFCHLPAGVKIPIRSEREGEVKLVIDPSEIRPAEAVNLEAGKYVFSGKLIQLTDEQGFVRATVHIGVPLQVLLSRDEMKRAGLNVGEELRIYIPEEAVKILD